MKTDLVYVGIRGHVLALSRCDGSIRWETKLKGSDFVTLAWEGLEVFAITAGEAFCLNAADGTIVWHNKLPGWGTGFASILVPGGEAISEVIMAAAHRREEERASSGTSPAT